ncbi:hypothetical protein PBAL39_16846 [Pedobacter sp. BAL39]|uniref:fasciclin domain-containing protein n=1 Tax=Pedobacter sp. BAL39 TaxID=391596 RepID=UPI000155934D|nr:fasciclin domain-containing protein [Pedobacter sp. BAL39]EDM35169.1 hypothetical protein PBAL39_16846 [Pedobacter sp. BAL39]
MKKFNIRLFVICLALLSLAACRKEEFQPEVEGIQIPHEDLTTTWSEALEASPYTLFKAAWKRSDMNSIIEKRGVQAPLTLLIPTDAAFLADGLTLDVINTTSPDLLDSLLLYHVISQDIEPRALSQRTENLVGITMLENTYLRLPGFENQYQTDPYLYRHYLGMSGNDLLINGKKADAQTPTVTKNGTIWPIGHLLKKPTKTMMQVLEEDGRFSMYVGIMTLTDQLWTDASYDFYPRSSPFKPGLIVDPIGWGPNIIFRSIFAPTDEAFHEAGFHSVDDLMALNNRVPLPYLNEETFEMVGTGYVTDTLLTMHRWGKLFKQADGWGYGTETPDIFYSNDLNNTLLTDYPLTTKGYTGSLPIVYAQFDFSKNAEGKVTMKVKGSAAPAATVIEGDINTLMGPIHVVNRLMPPKEFKY